jgi:hypothetical protein
MPTRGRGCVGRGRSRDGLAAAGSTAPGSRGVDEGQSSRGRGTVRPRSASPQTRRTRRRQANADAGPSERRPRIMIRGDQMPLRTIVDQILMERWKERQPIKRENHDCDCCRDPYRRGEGACGEPTKVFKSRRPLRIHYDRGLNKAERYAAFLRHAYDENEAVQGEGYVVSGDSFDPSESSSSGADRDREQWELNDYAENMPSRPADYMSDEDTSSDSGNDFGNLCRD